ncbi:MAG: hypothetical protein IPO36_18615 [Anaerolineales bacterium]|nr:hypothetical protein [Anaerolineales bacterium]
MYPIADFEVNEICRPADRPVIATSGSAEPNGEFTRYTLTAGVLLSDLRQP